MQEARDCNVDCLYANSLYVYDRHCDVIYYQPWQRPIPARPSDAIMPGVMRSLPSASNPAASTSSGSTNVAAPLPISQRFSALNLGGVTSSTEPEVGSSKPSAAAEGKRKGLPFDEESKLVYGVVFSLRNMVRKMSGRFVALL